MGFTADVYDGARSRRLFSVETRSLWTWSGAMRDLSRKVARRLLSDPGLLASLPAAGAQPSAPGPLPGSEDPLAEPDYRLPQRPHDLAVAVGVEHYSDLPDARYAVRDARAVYRHLLALGVPPRNVVFLADDKAGLASLEKYLELWLPRRVKEDSRVYFFFSGHGAPDPVTGAAYLVPWDGDANYLKKTGFPLKRLYADLSELGARQTFVALDACFSGAGPRSVLASNVRPLVTRVESALPRDPTLTVLTASGPRQVSVSLDRVGHGAFTYYLLKGLDGEAADASGRVTAAGLERYLAPRVEDAARGFGRDQTPRLWPPDSRLVLR